MKKTSILTKVLEFTSKLTLYVPIIIFAAISLQKIVNMLKDAKEGKLPVSPDINEASVN